VAFALSRPDIGDLVFEPIKEIVLSHESRREAA
jgi:UTP--glucose-1-phosphate uridylyltransferase